MRYPGTELDLFQYATRWKAYVSSQVRPFLGREVLEVGTGIGTTTRALWSTAQKRWVMLEPDPDLAHQLANEVARNRFPAACQVRPGTIRSLPLDERFDSLLYVDVLEHIHDDRGELSLAVTRLRPGGHLIVLSPAHQWLYSPFDEAIGHCRRYDRHTLSAIAPADVRLIRMRYLDAAGLLASCGNALVLRQATPTPSQILFWDRVLVPVSRLVDRCFGFRIGKSILGVWRV